MYLHYIFFQYLRLFMPIQYLRLSYAILNTPFHKLVNNNDRFVFIQSYPPRLTFRKMRMKNQSFDDRHDRNPLPTF